MTEMQTRSTAASPLVLAYHGVSASWPESLAVTPERLESQLTLLAGRGYRGVTFAEAVARASESKLLAVTFDDAHLSVVEAAAPILDSLGMVGTVFVPTAYVGAPEPVAWAGVEQWLHGDHRDELARASWAELKELSERGWEIGSHSHTHPHLPETSDADLLYELSHSRDLCEFETGRTCRSLAYPYGDFDDRVMAAAAAAGYSAAASLPRHRLSNRSPYAWPRIAMYRGDGPGRFRMKVNPVLRRLRASPALALGSRLSRGLR